MNKNSSSLAMAPSLCEAMVLGTHEVFILDQKNSLSYLNRGVGCNEIMKMAYLFSLPTIAKITSLA